MRALVRVIGCGTLDAGDDAAGVLAVTRATARLVGIEGVDVVTIVSPFDLVHELEDAEAGIVVDAIRTSGGRAPGTIVRLDVDRDGVPAELRSSLSSHGFGIAETLALLARLGPPRPVVLLGIEIGDAAVGGGLSAAVEAAMPRLVTTVVEEAAALADRVVRTPGGGPLRPTAVGSGSPG